MICQTFEIPGRLAGMNDLIGGINRHRFVGSKLKKEETRRCAEAAIVLHPIKEPIKITVTWFEPNNRRDLDNVAAGIKWILDGIVSAGKLPNDTRQWVKKISHEFPDPCPKNPRVVVMLSTFEIEMPF